MPVYVDTTDCSCTCEPCPCIPAFIACSVSGGCGSSTFTLTEFGGSGTGRVWSGQSAEANATCPIGDSVVKIGLYCDTQGGLFFTQSSFDDCEVLGQPEITDYVCDPFYVEMTVDNICGDPMTITLTE